MISDRTCPTVIVKILVNTTEAYNSMSWRLSLVDYVEMVDKGVAEKDNDKATAQVNALDRVINEERNNLKAEENLA